MPFFGVTYFQKNLSEVITWRQIFKKNGKSAKKPRKRKIIKTISNLEPTKIIPQVQKNNFNFIPKKKFTGNLNSKMRESLWI